MTKAEHDEAAQALVAALAASMLKGPKMAEVLAGMDEADAKALRAEVEAAFMSLIGGMVTLGRMGGAA